MGYYLEFNQPRNKAKQLIERFGLAQITSAAEAIKYADDRSMAVVVVCENGPFDAAGFCYNRREAEAFAKEDGRRKWWFVIPDRDAVMKYIGLTEDPANAT